MTAVLRELDVRSDTPFLVKVTEPWAATGAPGARCAYVVVDGRCEALAQGRPRGLLLGPGDVILFPRAESHQLRSTRGPWPEPVPLHGLASLERDGDSAGSEPGLTRLLCATLSLGGPLEHPAIAALPATVVLRAGLYPEPRSVRSCTADLVHELTLPLPASAVLLERLMDVVVLQALRLAPWSFGDTPSWFAGAADPLLVAALGRIHGEPEKRWTVAALAAETDRARGPFSTRFRQTVGLAPRAFLDQVRMHRAKKLLLTGRLPLAEVARSVGFGSHRAFRRAFVRATGMTPAAYRGSGASAPARRLTGPRAPSAPGPRAGPTDR